MSETQFYNLPREARARMVAYVWINGFVDTVHAWERSRKGAK